MGAGLLGMVVLATLRPSPAREEPGEKALRVDGVRVQAEDFPVTLTGHGTVRPLRTVAITAEVSGIVTQAHPSLRVGGVIPEGEVLFAIDDRDARAAVEEVSALAEQSDRAIERLREELRRNEDRIETGRRNLDLAQREFDRMRDLYEQHQVGSQAEIDAAERAFNTARDKVDELDKLLAVGPLLIGEAESARKAADARLDRARRQLARCTVRAPFRGRVVRALVETGQMAHPAAEMVLLADDSVLELVVSLDAREAQRWLRFQGGADADSAWIPGVEPVACRVRWTEDPDSHEWTGVLHRVEQMSLETRTLKVVVRVEGGEAENPDGFPLVQGMFCTVEIPGRTLRGVYRAPRWAVRVDRTVSLAVDGRLATRPVRIAHTHQDDVLIDQGLADGDILVVTRLGNPLEHALLDVRLAADAETPAP